MFDYSTVRTDSLNYFRSFSVHSVATARMQITLDHVYSKRESLVIDAREVCAGFTTRFTTWFVSRSIRSYSPPSLSPVLRRSSVSSSSFCTTPSHVVDVEVVPHDRVAQVPVHVILKLARTAAVRRAAKGGGAGGGDALTQPPRVAHNAHPVPSQRLH